MFKDVVVLDEQMRQQRDPEYHCLLKRIRDATITQADVGLLNTRVVTQLESRLDQIITCVVRTNRLRHAINRSQIETIPRAEDIYLPRTPHTAKEGQTKARSRYR
jgi:chromosome condensin MukBEF complex kleisin-like MukF subunit